MKTASPDPAPTHERCQHRTPKGRQCASRILDPESTYCPRHSASQPPDSKNFSAELIENACDFQDPQGINHSLAALYKLLASGRISSRRATGLAYIASMLLRTLPAINGNESTHFEIDVPPRPRFPEDDELRGKNPVAATAQLLAPHHDASQLPQVHLPAVAGLPAAVLAGLPVEQIPPPQVHPSAVAGHPAAPIVEFERGSVARLAGSPWPCIAAPHPDNRHAATGSLPDSSAHFLFVPHMLSSTSKGEFISCP
jgi:hypothetical protein